jgi:Ser/Thr protein kinase RdoA (MazF antagonist)
VARQLAELHFKMHNIVAPPGLRLQREQIESGIRMDANLPDATKDRVRRYLAELPDGEVLCHGDFHPDNVLLTARGPVIIDWMTGTRGYPLADVACTRLLILSMPGNCPCSQRACSKWGM